MKILGFGVPLFLLSSNVLNLDNCKNFLVGNEQILYHIIQSFNNAKGEYF